MTRRKDAKFFIKILIPLFFVLIILGYAYFRSRDLIQGIEITIDEPKDFSTLSTSIFDIKGKITKSSAVYINDRKIFLDESGNFNERLLLSPGFNIITVRAEDRFKRETEKKMTLVYKEM